MPLGNLRIYVGRTYVIATYITWTSNVTGVTLASATIRSRRRLAASATMRVLVQRVTSASVTVDGQVVGAVQPDGQGLLALVGVTHTDDEAKAQRLAEKLWQLDRKSVV